jgi:hypothetical protein
MADLQRTESPTQELPDRHMLQGTDMRLSLSRLEVETGSLAVALADHWCLASWCERMW